MVSSSTASMSRLRTLASSSSVMRAARTSSIVAVSRESSSCWESWRLMTANRPAPSRSMISPNVATYQIVRRSRRRTRRWMPGCDDEEASIAKAISGPAYGLDQLVWKIVVDLPPKPSHQHFEHVGERVVVFVPDVRGDGSAVDHLSMVQHEKLEQREFLSRELDRLARPAHAVRV